MKVPEMHGNNKLRDYKICSDYINEGDTMEELASKYDLSLNRISQIIYRNRGVLNADVKLEKAKRINWLRKQIKLRKDSKKDSADLVQQLKIEIEGDKPSIQINHSITEITVVTTKEDDENKLGQRGEQAEICLN